MPDNQHDAVMVNETELSENDFDLDLRISVAPQLGTMERDGYTTYTTCHSSCDVVLDQIRHDEPRMDGYTTYTTCHCC
jgi:hypothetical protein